MAIHTHGDAELEAINLVTERIIGAAIEVHRHLGPGLSERVYGDALAIEMNERAVSYEREVHRPVTYKGHTLGRYVIDFIVERRVIVEVKSVERPNPVFESQVMTYQRITGLRVGLLINFNSGMLRDGIKRIIL